MCKPREQFSDDLAEPVALVRPRQPVSVLYFYAPLLLGKGFPWPRYPLKCSRRQAAYQAQLYRYQLLQSRLRETLIDLLRRYESYSLELLDVIQFVVVDDGSPLNFEIPDFNLNITWLKITEDIAWNLGGARNLGAVYAKSDKIILADLDHAFPEPMFQHALKMRNPGRVAHAVPSQPRHLASAFPRKYAYICNDREMKEHDHNLQRESTRNQQIYLRKRNEAHYWGAEAGTADCSSISIGN